MYFLLIFSLMKIELSRVNAPFHYEACNENNIIVNMDSKSDENPQPKGASPMELVLMGLGGCASIDLGIILNKQKQVLEAYKLVITATRDTTPAKAFKSIKMDFKLFGQINKLKAEEALDLTLNKYCSVALSLSKNIDIEYTYEILKCESEMV